jgi:DMATS type aromatic prenyltransferase
MTVTVPLPGVLSTTSSVLDLVSRILPARDEDKDFWWAVTSKSFAQMLQEAEYPVHLQWEYLLFHYYAVVPSLGARPSPSGTSAHAGFLTNSSVPIEFSWRWDGVAPDVRYTIESRGPLTDTPIDVGNQVAAKQLMLSLSQTLPSADTSLFWKLAALLQPRGTDPDELTSIFIAFEFLREGIMPKAYWMFGSTAGATKFLHTTWPALVDELHAENKTKPEMAAYEALRSFLDTDAVGKTMIPYMMAIDCVATTKSRVKVYVRIETTSLQAIYTVLSIGGTRPLSEEQKAEFKDLYCSLLGLDASTLTDSDELPSIPLPTAGMHFYFDVREGRAVPEVKGYIPVGHYGKSDGLVADGLVGFLERRGRGQHTAAFRRMLAGFAPEERMKDEKMGLQRFFSYSFSERGGLDLTSYLEPRTHAELAEDWVARGLDKEHK